MKYELSHDILAKKVYEKASATDKMEKRIEAFIHERYAYFQLQKVYLGSQDIAYITPFLSTASISKEEKNFIETSRQRAKMSENKQLFTRLALIIFPILLGLSGFALYQSYQATKATKELKIEKDRADDNAEEAQVFAKEAKISESEAIRQKEVAEEQRKVAEEQKRLAEKQKALAEKYAKEVEKEADKARVQAKRADSERKRATAAAAEAKRQEGIALEQAKLAAANSEEAKSAELRAKEQQRIAEEQTLIARTQADISEQLRLLAIEKQKEARALYLASLSDNALRQKKGIIAYNIAKMSWQLDNNLLAQKVLFDCQNAYLTDQSIFGEYQEKAFASYADQAIMDVSARVQQKSIDKMGRLGDVIQQRVTIEEKGENHFVFSPDKKLFATLSSNEKLTIKAIKGGKILSEWKSEHEILDAKFSMNNEFILLKLNNNTAELKTVKGELVKVFKHDAPLTSVELSNSTTKTYIATVSADRVGKLWSEKGVLLHQFTVVSTDFEVTPYIDGQSVLALSPQKTPALVNFTTKKTTTFSHPRQANTKYIKAVFSPNSDYVLSKSSDGLVILWNAVTGAKMAEMPHSSPVDIARFSPSGTQVLTSSAAARMAYLWDFSGKQEAKFYYKGFDPVNSVEFSDDGLRILVGQSKIANLWGIKGSLLYSFEATKAIALTGFSTDFNSILVANVEGSIDIWNIVTPQAIIDYYDKNANIRPLTIEEETEYGIVATDYSE